MVSLAGNATVNPKRLDWLTASEEAPTGGWADKIWPFAPVCGSKGPGTLGILSGS